ncbi:hypothetical protein KVR01_010050 [Diaporthe batatas]|uniref:uncharacterized protein n=1 Tax=Diaporthe batatas TaxID=748121 RepID=UPI001D058083|nr:uncharacterized protein KVR01_010050 [Diaporthe batatas]KAG8160514.1 hypothetical protein KVR01_010050 [Diaporthe batatas]
MGQSSTSASPVKIMVRPARPARHATWLPAAAGESGIWYLVHGPWPMTDGRWPMICQTRPLPRLACEHVPASVPDITTAVLPSRAQSTVGCPRMLWAGSHVPSTACGSTSKQLPRRSIPHPVGI